MMKLLVVAALAAVTTVRAVLSEVTDASVSAINPFQGDVNGHSVWYYPYTVTVTDVAARSARGYTYYATGITANFLSATIICEQQGQILASPKTQEEQDALVKLSSTLLFNGNLWLSGYCFNNVWTWGDGTKVEFNKLGNNGIVGKTMCGTTSNGLMMFGPYNVPGVRYTWKGEDSSVSHQVICEAIN